MKFTITLDRDEDARDWLVFVTARRKGNALGESAIWIQNFMSDLLKRKTKV